MRYVFVIPKYIYGFKREAIPVPYYVPPLGIGYVMSALKQSGREVTCLNLNETDIAQNMNIPSAMRKSEMFKAFNPETDIVLTGGLSPNYNTLQYIVTGAKKAGFRTILGGGILTAEPEVVFDLLRPTYGVIGEAERTIVELVSCIEKGIDPSGVAGIIYEKGGSVVKTAARETIKDIDSLPYPEYDLIGVPEVLSRMTPVDEYFFQQSDTPQMVPISCSRSCPYDCSFCMHPLGKGYRERGLDSIFQEVEHVVEKYKVNTILFIDELFGKKPDRLMEFCTRIKKYNISWLCQLRVDSVNEQVLVTMREAGCCFISYGIESINNSVLKGMHKHITKEQIEMALELTYKAGIGIQGNFIFGSTEETVATYTETMDWWKTHPKYMLNLTATIPYPGSLLYEQAVAKGAIPSKQQYLISECPPVNTANMTNAEFDKMSDTVFHLQTAANPQCMATEVSRVKEGMSDRGYPLAKVNFTCPHCNHKNEFRNILYGLNPWFRQNFRYACRKCNQRSDMVLKI